MSWFGCKPKVEEPKPPRERIELQYPKKPKCECCERAVKVVVRIPLPNGERLMISPLKSLYVDIATSVRLCSLCLLSAYARFES